MDPAQNGVLAALPDALCEHLVALGTVLPLELRATLVEPDEALTRVIFPLSGAISLLTVMNDGESVEAGLIGREGMLGPVGKQADSSTPWRAVVQMSGEALSVPAAALAANAELVHALQPLERRYETALHWLATLSIACNRFHSLEQRCARWLLMMRDRADGDRLAITHEFLSEMLGARRQSVTRALNALERDGLIRRVRRSEVEIADRAGLERASCECYERMRGLLPGEPLLAPRAERLSAL